MQERTDSIFFLEKLEAYMCPFPKIGNVPKRQIWGYMTSDSSFLHYISTSDIQYRQKVEYMFRRKQIRALDWLGVLKMLKKGSQIKQRCVCRIKPVALPTLGNRSESTELAHSEQWGRLQQQRGTGVSIRRRGFENRTRDLENRLWRVGKGCKKCH